VVILLQAQALVGTDCCDLLKQGAHVLGLAHRECPPRVVGRKCGVSSNGRALSPLSVAHVPDGEQANGSASEVRQVALT
jgi:hypothetical protein